MSIDSKILTALRAAGADSVSGGDLSHKLGISRAAIWARIEELRALGYDISASPHHGYRLVSVPDVLHADDLRSLLHGKPVVGREIQVFQETTSTNDLVERMAQDGVTEGMVVFAESQTRGRGRLGRRWSSPSRKGLWFSVLLRPAIRPQRTTQLTVGTAVALVSAILNVTGIQSEIKWPNDILIRGKKVAGILTELSAELDSVKHVILGIGVDVNVKASEFPAELRTIATSLSIELGKMVNRAELAADILHELDGVYRTICAGDFEKVADQWEQSCSTVGHNVAIRVGDRVIRGRAESLDNEGALCVRTEHGRLERVVGGDVTVER
jgi:BirA family biotin operon repressor/biotin-[acetyl-CoA-carboxylase] ligase